MKLKKIYILTLVMTLFLSMSSFATEAEPTPPELNGSFAVAIDVQTKEIIFSKGGDEKTFPASTTKIMTALIFAEHKTKTDVLSFTENALKQPSYALNTDYGPISLGYEMTGDMVMKSLLIYSANDVAAMVEDALALDGIDLMKEINDRIEALGLINSQFTSPNGIHDENHYTTAYDLAMMAIEAFNNPWLQEVLSMDEVIIEIESGLLPVPNSNQKLNSSGPIFSKTGYTPEAGRCLVAIYERDGRKIVGAVMNAEYNYEDVIVFEDMDKLMNWSFNEAKKVSYLDTADFDFNTELSYMPLKIFGKEEIQTIPLVYREDLMYYPNPINNREIKSNFEIYEMTIDNLSVEEPIGKITLSQRNLTSSIDLYPTLSKEDIYAQHEGLYRIVQIGVVVGIIVIALVLITIFVKIRKKLRSHKRYF